MNSAHSSHDAFGRAHDATADRVLALIMRGGKVVWSDDICRQIEAQLDGSRPLATRQRAFDEVFRIAMYVDRRFGSVPACEGLCDLLERHLGRIQLEAERARERELRRIGAASVTRSAPHRPGPRAPKSSQKS